MMRWKMRDEYFTCAGNYSFGENPAIQFTADKDGYFECEPPVNFPIGLIAKPAQDRTGSEAPPRRPIHSGITVVFR